MRGEQAVKIRLLHVIQFALRIDQRQQVAFARLVTLARHLFQLYRLWNHAIAELFRLMRLGVEVVVSGSHLRRHIGALRIGSQPQQLKSGFRQRDPTLFAVKQRKLHRDLALRAHVEIRRRVQVCSRLQINIRDALRFRQLQPPLLRPHGLQGLGKVAVRLHGGGGELFERHNRRQLLRAAAQIQGRRQAAVQERRELHLRRALQLRCELIIGFGSGQLHVGLYHFQFRHIARVEALADHVFGARRQVECRL